MFIHADLHGHWIGQGYFTFILHIKSHRPSDRILLLTSINRIGLSQYHEFRNCCAGLCNSLQLQTDSMYESNTVAKKKKKKLVSKYNGNSVFPCRFCLRTPHPARPPRSVAEVFVFLHKACRVSYFPICKPVHTPRS